MVGSVRTFIDQARTGNLDDVLTVNKNKQVGTKSGVLGGRSATSVAGNKIGPGEKNALDAFKKALMKDFGDDSRDLMKAIGIDNNTKVLTKGHVEALRIEMMHGIRHDGKVVTDPKQLAQQQHAKDDKKFLKYVEQNTSNKKDIVSAVGLHKGELAALRIALSGKEAKDKKLAFKKLDKPAVQPKQGNADPKNLRHILASKDGELRKIEQEALWIDEDEPDDATKLANKTLRWMRDAKQLAADPTVKTNRDALDALDRQYERARKAYNKLLDTFRDSGLKVVPDGEEPMALLQHKIKP